MAESSGGGRSLIDRYSALVIALAAAMWATDAFFRPNLVNAKGWDLSPSEVVLGETLLISLCFVPVAPSVVRELRRASWRTWLALGAIAAGPQAIATVLFTQSLTYAFSSSLTQAESTGIQSEVYLLYLLQPVFGGDHGLAVAPRAAAAGLLAARCRCLGRELPS